ncbi:MAG TPA: Crp/Fnr family transcriptional regulator [Anaeromyxobacteraceae bacterium]|nr:Crp/Fnr family transcriptional regulator [Anaeromyxobacteraceae bacterium]
MNDSAATSRARLRELLRNVSIFNHLDAATAADLERLGELREYPAGAVIVGQDDPGDALFVLARGKVKVVLFGKQGREIILTMFKSPGDFFGEMSLLDDEPRSATVVAVEPSALYVLSRAAFRAHVEAQPATALRVLQELSRRLRQADRVIGNLALLDVWGRVAGKLRELARADGVEAEDGVLIRDRPTQSEIAAMVGTSRETVSRAISEFTRRGFIQTSGKKMLLRRAFLIDQG